MDIVYYFLVHFHKYFKKTFQKKYQKKLSFLYQKEYNVFLKTDYINLQEDFDIVQHSSALTLRRSPLKKALQGRM